MKVSGCCCGCSLKDGCMIIGILQVVFAKIGLVACIVFLCSEDIISNLVDTLCDNYTTGEDDDFCRDDPMEGLRMTFWFYLAVFLISLIMGASLIYGVRSGKFGYLTPWLVYTALSILGNIGVNIYQMVDVGSTAIWSSILNIAFTTVIYGYFFIVVKSYRAQLRQELMNNITNGPQGFVPQQTNNQQYPNQAYNYGKQAYPNQPYGNQAHPNQPYGNQAYPNQPYVNQAYPPNQPYGNQPYPNQPPSYDGVNGTKY